MQRIFLMKQKVIIGLKISNQNQSVIRLHVSLKDVGAMPSLGNIKSERNPRSRISVKIIFRVFNQKENLIHIQNLS